MEQTQRKAHNRWTDDEVQALLSIYADEEIQRGFESATRNDKVYATMSGKLSELDIVHTGRQCREKLKKLKQDYKKIKDHNNTSGSAWRTSKWFDRLDAVLGPRPPSSGAAGTEEATVDSDPENQSEGKQRSTWSADEVQAFLRLWSDRNIQSRPAHHQIYIQLSSELADLGFYKSPNRCREKIKRLKQYYKRIKTLGGPKGRQNRWFAMLDSVLGQPAGPVPVEPAQPSRPACSELERSGKCPSWSPVEVQEVFGFQGGGLGLETVSPASESSLHHSTLLSNYNYPMCSRWTEDEVQVLLTLWADGCVQEQLTSAVPKERVFSQLSSELCSLGFNKTPSQCRMKIKMLKQEYRMIREEKESKRRDSAWFAVMDAVLGQRGFKSEEPAEQMKSDATSTPESSLPGFLQQAKHVGTNVPPSGSCLTFSSLSLLVPPLRLMSAFAWQVIQHRNVMHYGKVEELVRLVTEMVPDLLDPRETVQLLLGLRARLVLELFRRERTADPVEIQLHLDTIQSLRNHSTADQEGGDEIENSKSNFVELIQTLLKDPEEKMTFLQEVFPVHYGPGYEAALQTLVWQFICRLDRLLPIPDVTQTAEWLSAAPSVLEECGQLVVQPGELKTLLYYHQRQQGNGRRNFPCHSGDAILSVLALPAKAKPRDVTREPNNSHRDKKRTRYGTEPSEGTDASDGTEPTHGSGPEASDGTEPTHGSGPEASDGTEPTHGSGPEASDGTEPTLGSGPEASDGTEPTLGSGPEASDGTEPTLGSGPEASDGDRRDEALSGHSREEEKAAEEKQSAEEWIPEDHSRSRRDDDSDVKRQQQKILSPVQRSGCSLCPFSHSQMSGLLQHSRTEHQVTDSSCLDSVPEGSVAAVKGRIHKISTLKFDVGTHTLYFHCNQCEKRYTSKWSLTKHQRVHTGERPYLCSHCGRFFICSGSLRVHVRTHTGDRPYKCHICGKTSIQHLARHMLMHKGEKNFLCAECGKTFLSSGELKLHTRYHTGERLHTCKHCGKGFTAKCHMTVHMRIHTGERPYRCTQCPKSFPTSGQRKIHTLIHCSKKPHRCVKCGKGFTQLYYMKTHIRMCKM